MIVESHRLNPEKYRETENTLNKWNKCIKLVDQDIHNVLNYSDRVITY